MIKEENKDINSEEIPAEEIIEESSEKERTPRISMESCIRVGIFCH